MVAKCPVCGAHVPTAVAVEILTGDSVERFCSLRCAVSADPNPTCKVRPTALPQPPKRILVAVDGSGPSLRATELAAAMAAAMGGEIELLHAIDPNVIRALPREPMSAGRRLGFHAGEVEAYLREETETQLERYRKVCEAADVKVTSRIETKPPARAIAEAAEEFDLIVMGSRGLDALSGAALGSLSHRVIAETRRPVLVVH